MSENKEVFADGQWWLAELDQMVTNGTPDQKRAVAVVRNLVRQHGAAPAPVAQPAGDFEAWYDTVVKYVEPADIAAWMHDAWDAGRASAHASVAQLPEDFLDWARKRLTRERAGLVGFVAIGNELRRAATYDRWIAALNATPTRACQPDSPKHRAVALADDLDEWALMETEQGKMLRTIPALEADIASRTDLLAIAVGEIGRLEAERDALHEARFREAAEMGLEIEELKAERDALRETLGKVAILLHAAGMPSDRVTVMDGVEMLTKDRDTQEEAVGELRAMLAQQIAERDALKQGWSRFHHLMAKHGLHPGRTDDDLLEILDRSMEASKADKARMDWLEQTPSLMVSANNRSMRDWLMARPAGAGNLRAAIDAARGAA